MLRFTSLFLLVGCAVTNHAVIPSALGTPSRTQALALLLDTPGPIAVESVASADWHVPLSGLLNLDHPSTAAMEDHEEPIQVYFHVLHHPTRGMYIIDTGIERALKNAPDEAAIQGIVASFMHADDIVVHKDLATYLEGAGEPLKGVLMTHLHVDHVSGMRDVPHGTPIYVGPGESTTTQLMNVFVRGSTDRALDGQAPLQEWQFAPDTDATFAGVIDVFGDGSLFALHVPGHTVGSTAYIARTPHGPVLFTGDASHTAWGWQHDVEPGTYSADAEQTRDSFQILRRFVAAHPEITVRVGHQAL